VALEELKVIGPSGRESRPGQTPTVRRKAILSLATTFLIGLQWPGSSAVRGRGRGVPDPWVLFLVGVVLLVLHVARARRLPPAI
jgi:hypothetical protein